MLAKICPRFFPQNNHLPSRHHSYFVPILDPFDSSRQSRKNILNNDRNKNLNSTLKRSSEFCSLFNFKALFRFDSIRVN